MNDRSAVCIIDVGLGNIASVQRIIEKAGGKAIVVKDPKHLERYSKVILPGVGHFDHGMSRLTDAGFVEILGNLRRDQDTRVLGICLGMQLLCRGSEEGYAQGLALMDADVERFRFPTGSKLKVPHMGWNVVSLTQASPLFSNCSEEQRFYFVHSYRVVPDDPAVTICTSYYGGEFCAAFQKENIFGVQFHPEKSHRFGLSLMKRFVEL